MSTSIPCRAKNPRTCPYHGAEIEMNEARDRGDYSAYLTALDKFQEASISTPEVLDFFNTPAAAEKTPLQADIEREGELVSEVLQQAMELGLKRNPYAKRREIVALYKQVPNEVVAETVLHFMKGVPGHIGAVTEAENISMYQAIAGGLGRYQPTGELAEKIATSGDERAKLLLASHLPQSAKAINGNINNLLDILGKDEDPEVRAYVAQTPEIYHGTGLSNDLTQRLATDDSTDVRYALANNPALALEDAEKLESGNDFNVTLIANERASEMRAEIQRREQAEAARRRDYEEREAAGTLRYWERDDFEEIYGDDA